MSRDRLLDNGIVFFHIGKTAGTALRASLEVGLGEGNCSPPFVQSYMNQADANYYASFPIISGHISRRDQRKWFPTRHVMTILRDPLERGFSFLRYVQSLPEDAAPIASDAKRMSCLELIETEEAQRNLDNAMVRQLGAHLLDKPLSIDDVLAEAKQTLDEALWVGFQDRLEQDFLALQALFGRSMPLRVENVTDGRQPLAHEDPAVLQRLLELSVHDRQLWDWARAKFGVDGENCST